MPRSISSMKRTRQSAKRGAENRAKRSLIKTSIRKVNDAVHAKDAAAAEKAYRDAVTIIDRFSDRGVLHRNTAARRKSLLARRINALKA